jgi:hypothetical protein
MKCRDLDLLLAEGGPFDEAARQHLSECARCAALAREMTAQKQVPEATITQAAAMLRARARKVRRMPSRPWLTAGFALLAGGLGVGLGWATGLEGVAAMSATQQSALLLLGAAALGIAADLLPRIITPGSRFLMPGLAQSLCAIAMLGLIGTAFPWDHSLVPVEADLGCFRAVLLLSIPATLGVYLLMRVGSPPVTAITGFAAGLVIGCAGFIAVQMHCAIPEGIHILGGHVLPVLVAGLIGAGLAEIVQRVRGSA